MRRRLTMLVLAGLAVGSAGAAIGTTTASAGPLCQSVTTGGDLGYHQVGPTCVPYGFVAECNTTTVSALPYAYVSDYACVPAYAPNRAQ